jgi:methyl-accepting chemotaxis protein
MTSVKDSTNAMSAIRESSDNVNRITTLIADIARQTNLLSLNAAIEAAKAGTHGRGFAAVAEEIRKLAERSASAAKEISTLIHESGQRVEAGSKAVREVDTSLLLIQNHIRDNASQIKEIATSMTSQAQAKDQVVGSIQRTLALTERNASATAELMATITETARTVEELAHLASQLRALTSYFRVH